MTLEASAVALGQLVFRDGGAVSGGFVERWHDETPGQDALKSAAESALRE